jgi:hypothetical protein
MPTLESDEEETQVDVLSRRYTDAYRVANGIVAWGNLVKVLGFILGTLIVIVTIALQAKVTLPQGSQFPFVIVGGAVSGFSTVIAFWSAGVLISAQGKMMGTIVDTAVNTCPILNNDERAEIMEL